ncbi:hypothetical protein, partial [Geodermatophilus sp. TF02-6]|uniref:hypothetical protein n=1 Tax=Geodermatophilus sp. TF02-6 TaxID=2250575 RepID=UPI001F190E66
LQQIGMDTRPAGEHDVLIAQDGGVAKARRLMQQLLAAETTDTGSTGRATTPALTTPTRG